MRILVLCSMDIRKKGADKVHLVEICENLKNLGNEILLVAPGYMPLKKIEVNFPVHYIKVRKKSYFTYIFYHLKLQIQFYRILKEFRPDIIYSRGIRNGFLLYEKLRHRNIPFVIEKNSIMSDEFKSRGFNKIFVKSIEILERLNARNCDGIVAVTDSIKEELVKRYKIHYDKIIVIPNGANHKLFIPMDKKRVRRELHLDEESFIVGFVGSFAPWQNLDLLVEAANLIKRRELGYNIKFLLVGDGETKEEIVKLIKSYNLQSDFILPGRVDYYEVPVYVNACDVVVAIKSKSQGIKLFSPLKFFEYAFCGVPIIFSNNIIGDGLNAFKDKLGYEIEENNSEELAEAILRAYENIGILQENISKVRNILMENYSWLSSAKKVEKFLNLVKELGV